ncbi:MAG: Holliday junction resolvase RuvX [Candidatus Peribacteraceae bacterium]|jgi:putative Holliday junction resolvase|nr:Holliday junction resolvase RuvX [Candidatus Peribacteraceae bacterium]MDP7454060.1 Holliday junction resolvase RuvX [Candidatus Peribacteraceae bacterium]MDP7646334.1 Holliday junction resolvase RuvX [Candidatus Peribacteraceae bacterium]
MHIIALDIGMKHTGVAYYFDETNIAMPLDTIDHKSDNELIEAIKGIASERDCQKLIIGLPLLSSGKVGEQAEYTKSIADILKNDGFEVNMIDERYTTPKTRDCDPNAHSAVKILNIYLEMSEIS